MGRSDKRRKELQLLDDIMEKRRYWNFKEETIASWRELALEKSNNLSSDRRENELMILMPSHNPHRNQQHR
jgi:hypothetical protein